MTTQLPQAFGMSTGPCGCGGWEYPTNKASNTSRCHSSNLPRVPTSEQNIGILLDSVRTLTRLVFQTCSRTNTTLHCTCHFSSLCSPTSDFTTSRARISPNWEGWNRTLFATGCDFHTRWNTDPMAAFIWCRVDDQCYSSFLCTSSACRDTATHTSSPSVPAASALISWTLHRSSTKMAPNSGGRPF